MNPQMYQAGILAVPIKPKADANPLAPNFLVIENDGGRVEDYNFFNPITGESEPTVCKPLTIYFVHRKPWNSNRSVQNMVFPSKSNMEYIPYQMSAILASHEVLKSQIGVANALLSLFQFVDGHILEGTLFEIDTDALDEIIETKRLTKIVEKVYQKHTLDQVTEYLAEFDLELADITDLVEPDFIQRLEELPV